MSQQYYLKKWEIAQEDLNRVINLERPPKPEPLPKTLKEAFERICLRYLQYIGIYKRLLKCYDYMVHPQKRHLIDRCIEGVTGRIVELRHDLFRIRINEYAGLGPFCVAFKILPSDFDMKLSNSFMCEKMKRLQHRIELLEYAFASIGRTEEAESLDSLPVSVKQMGDSASETVEFEAGAVTRGQSVEQMEMKRKLVNWKKVQYQFKIFQNRLLVDALRNNTDIFLGMQYVGKEHEHFEEIEKQVVAKRISKAEDHEVDYVQHLLVATETLKDSKAARTMEENMLQNIRQWILECREATGNFPDYPSKDIGGSAAIFMKKTPEQLQEEIENAEDEKGKQKPKEKPKEKKPKKPEPLQGFVVMNSNFIDEVLIDVANEYETYWRDGDESSNFKQEFSKNLLEEKVNENLEDLIREQIDEQMRYELEIMTMAVDKLKAAKAKKSRTKLKKEKAKKDKKKKMKDLTPGADPEDLYVELVKNNIIKRVKSHSLHDYQGEINLMSEVENGGEECRPDLGDIRQMIFDFVVLPLSNKNVHERAPCSKSLMIAGPRGCGKSLLVHAICHELGANMFDLTAANIQGKYNGPEGQQMLMHLVLKVGKLLEPSIIFIDDCELMFMKKVPPEITSNPGRMKKNLMKALKVIDREDRIMLIGTTSKPYNAAKGPLLKMYEKVIVIYPPAYASRYTIWTHTIKAMGGNITKSLQVSVLAQISSNFTARDIVQAIMEVLTVKRINRQANKALTTSEFGDRISNYTPVYREELQILVDWVKETPLAKKREQIKELVAAGFNIYDMI